MADDARRTDILEDARDGVRWLATEHATGDTPVMGEGWQVCPGPGGEREGQSIIGLPSACEPVLVSTAALESYPPEDVDSRP